SVLDQVLGGGEVAGDTHERCRQARRMLAHNACELLTARLGVKIPAVCASHGSSGRTSTIGQPAYVLTMRNASFRLATSISVYPLTTSLPSTNGPSVTSGSLP